MSQTPLVLLSAAEPSGDRLGAAIALALRARGPVRLAGLAGPAMREAGVEVIARAEDVSVMGIAEVLAALPRVLRVRERMRAAIGQGATAFVGIDAPDLNLGLARAARKMGIPAIGVVAPQVWAWRRGRAATVSRSIDQLLCLFSFEPELFPGLDARFIGHPAVDRLAPFVRRNRPHFKAEDMLILMPGSRPSEVRRMLPAFLVAAAAVRARRPGIRVRLVAPPGLALPPLPEWLARVDRVEELGDARMALTKSGTATLELALLGVPMVVAHAVSPWTWLAGKLLIRQIKHIAMPNLLADFQGLDAPVPEFIQKLKPNLLAAALLNLPERQNIPLDALGQGGAAARAAELIAARWERP